MYRLMQRFCLRRLTASRQVYPGHVFCGHAPRTKIASNFQQCNLNSSASIEDLTKIIDLPLPDDCDHETESSHKNVDIDAVTEGDQEKLKAFKLIQLEINLRSQRGERMPSTLQTYQWKELLTLPSRNQRNKYLTRLWLNEVRKSHRKEKLRKKVKENDEFRARKILKEPKVMTTSSPVDYGLKENTLFYRITIPRIHNFYNYKLFLAEWFGPQIIIDCDYEHFMTHRHLMNCAKQMLFMWSENRENFNPFDLFFCNVNKDGLLWKKFAQIFHSVDNPHSPVHYTDKHYLSLFPKQKFVYLTPHCHEELENFNPDDIYIIAAFVDGCRNEPVSLAKAKREDLRKAKFPLDKYLKWAMGSKSLALNHVTSILNGLKDGQPWTEALKRVPKRNIDGLKSHYEPDNEERCSHLSAKEIRENYRQNLVHDLLMREKMKSFPNEN